MKQQNGLYQLFQKDFHQYYDPLCRYALTLLKEPHSCEDVVQETFLRVWEKRQDLVGTEVLRFYLYRAVRNNCLSFLEKKQRTFLIHPAETNDFQPSFELRKERSDINLAISLKEAIDQLPPRCREIFVLSRTGGLTYKEIASTLSISVKTVENQMGKALKMLRSFVRQSQNLVPG